MVELRWSMSKLRRNVRSRKLAYIKEDGQMWFRRADVERHEKKRYVQRNEDWAHWAQLRNFPSFVHPRATKYGISFRTLFNAISRVFCVFFFYCAQCAQ